MSIVRGCRPNRREARLDRVAVRKMRPNAAEAVAFVVTQTLSAPVTAVGVGRCLYRDRCSEYDPRWPTDSWQCSVKLPSDSYESESDERSDAVRRARIR
jgi:hypothetical protein